MDKIEYKYIVAILCICVLFIDRLDMTIVNIALPQMARYFQVAITRTEWVMTGFLLALAIAIPISGWLGDKFGCRKMFILATAVFGITSFLCAFSPNLAGIIALRFLQGLSGGMLIPVSMTMVYRAFAPAEFVSITGIIFVFSLIAPAIAPALGGLITHYFGWKWVFMFSLPICLVAVALAAIHLKEDKIAETPALDWGGFIWSAIALLSMLYTLSLLGRIGINWLTSCLLVASCLFIFQFIRHEKQATHPLINLNFFKQKLFLQANILQVAFQICHFGAIFLISLYLQVGIGMSALASGIIMGMQAIGAMCIKRGTFFLFERFGPKAPIMVGFVGLTFFTLCTLLITNINMLVAGAIIFFMRGIFSGMCGPPIQTMSVVGFDKDELSRTSAIFNAGRQVSITLGIALSSLLISYGYKANKISPTLSINPILAHNIFQYAFFMIPLVAFIGILVAMTINTHSVRTQLAQ